MLRASARDKGNQFERVFWWGVIAICAIPTVARIFRPELGENANFVALQQFCFGTVMAVAVAAGIYARYPAWKDAVPHSVHVISQRRWATILGYLVIAPLLFFLAVQGIFDDAGGWILLPACFIGPVMYIRDRFKKGSLGHVKK